MFSLTPAELQYGKTSHGNITTASREEVVEQQSRLVNNNKRPSTSRSVNWNQPSTSKRCRRNSFSSSEPAEGNTTNYMDPDYSCSSNNSGSFSPSCHQQTRQQEHVTDETSAHNQQRLHRTTEMLKESGLYDVAVRTAALIRQNQQSRKELEELREETKLFLKDVLNNPENKKICQVLSGLKQNQENLQNSSLDSSEKILNS